MIIRSISYDSQRRRKFFLWEEGGMGLVVVVSATEAYFY